MNARGEFDYFRAGGEAARQVLCGARPHALRLETSLHRWLTWTVMNAGYPADWDTVMASPAHV
jgi:hypothetical protein